MLFYRQIKGIIALAILLAVIPFFYFVHHDTPDDQGPVFSISGNHDMAVELIDNAGKSGIYFVAPFMTLQQFLQSIDSNIVIEQNSVLENGLSVNLQQSMKKEGIVLGKMSAGQRIALEMPLNVNLASVDDLMLVPGLGESTAQKIVDRRQEIGKFKRLEQLMEISGIKERKFSKLSRYLYVEKLPN